MGAIQLYAKMPGSAEYTLLDLHETEPIKLTLSVQDIQDPLAATSSFSRTFRVPHTGVNGPFFKGVFNVNSTNFDASKKADAYILDNGQFFTNGNIRLISIFSSDYDGKVEYEITFFGETSDFGSKIGGGFLNELNFTQYNHNKTWNNIVQSWTNGLFSGDVVYGLIEWGYTYNANNQPIQPTLSNGFSNSFTLSSKALLLEQWKPQFRAKAIWDTIFEESGYTYDSQFIDSAFFKGLYVISENVAQATLNRTNTFIAEQSTSSTNVVGAQARPLITPNIISDPGGNFNGSTLIYTAPSAGAYTFTYDAGAYLGWGGGGFFPPLNIDAVVQFRIIDAVTQSTIATSGPQFISEGYTTIGDSVVCSLGAGQQIKFTLDSYCNGGQCFTGSTQLELLQTRVACTIAPDILSINSIMPSNVRKIDFMRSIINRFRLVFVPSRDNEMHFTIVPWKDWILQGNSLDWSNKLDTSKDLKITPLFYGQDRFQIYKDQEDGDYLNYQYQLTYKQTVGQLNLDSTNELIKGTKITQDQFAPTPIAPIGYKDGDTSGSRFLIPHIAKDTGSNQDTTGTTVITGKREPIQPKLRLVFYNGLITSPLTWYARTQNESQGTSFTALNTYPLMSSYSSWPITPTTVDLNWENEPPFWNEADTYLGSGNVTNSVFNVYWKTWYDVTFDPYSRIVEANMILDYGDILDLKFNDYIFIKDAWYFVNKISDFIVGQKTNCRVELIKVGNIGLTLPIVTPQYTEVTLCRGVDVCSAYCCIANQGAVDGTYWINGATLGQSNTIYSNSTGTTFAPAGYYSDGSVVAILNASGAITSFGNTAPCSCAQTGTSFTGTTSQTLCTVCCGNGSAITVYGLSSTFASNGFLYLNDTLTIPAPSGWYLISGNDPVFVGANGQITQIGTCTACECTVYYPHIVCVDTTSCNACCCYNPTVTVFSTSTVFTSSTALFLDNSGTQPAPVGSYKKGNNVANITGTSGVITTFSLCTPCSPCIEGDIEVYVEIFVERGGYNSGALLQKSFDNINWVDVGELEIIPTDGSNVTLANSYFLNPSIYTRVVFTSNVDGGTMTSEHLVNTTSIQEVSNSTPGSRTLTSDILVDGNIYKFLCRIEGGFAPPSDRVYVGGNYNLYQDAATFPCGNPSCGPIEAILALDQTAEIVEQFNTETNFSFPGISTFGPIVYDLQKVGDYIAVGYNGLLAVSQPNSQSTYKGVPVTNGIVLLNTDGSLNTSFNTTKGAQGSSQVYTIASTETHVFAAGAFYLWNQGTIGGANNTIGTAIAKLNISNGTLDSSFLWQATASFERINRIKINGNKIYVGGQFEYTYLGGVWRNMLRLNMDGTIDTTWSNKGTTSVSTQVYDFEFYGNSVYVVGDFTNWNSTSTQGGATINSSGIVKLSVADGSPQTFNVGTGFTSTLYGGDQFCKAAAVDPTGIYICGDFTNYNGVDVPNFLIKLNHDATVNTTFVVQNMTGQGLLDPANDVKLSPSGELYVGGSFATYGTTTSKGLVKLNSTTGAIITQFAVAEGVESLREFGPPPFVPYSGIVNVILIPEGDIPVPTLYEFGLCYSAESPCTAYCCTGTTFNDVWGNGPSLTTSTVLYANAGGTVFAAPGYYSDGTSIAQVSSNGVIIAFVNPAGCKCNVTVKQFHVVYDADTACDACCGIPNTNVWSNATTWSTTSILYSDSGATTFASPGYYNFAGIVLTIGSNGVVLEANICECSCPSEDCYVWIINNNSGESQASYSYTDCNGTPRFGTLPPLTATITTCTTYSSLTVTGDVSIDLDQSCVDEIDVVNVFGYMEPCIGGTIDDYMGAAIYLSAPVTVDTTFDVEVKFAFPGALCNPSYFQSQYFQLVVPAGEQSSNFNACNNGAYFPGGATICSACVNSYYNNIVDVINLGSASC
jgi:hypothetical protein